MSVETIAIGVSIAVVLIAAGAAMTIAARLRRDPHTVVRAHRGPST